MRGEGTAYSDLDLVVIYGSVTCAYRESFEFKDLPVESFVHDPATLNYSFREVDRLSGVPSLARMVAEGVEGPGPSETSKSLKALASAVILMGPPTLSVADEQKLRYGITDLIDDLRAPRSWCELAATGSQLFEALADYYFRAKGSWSARGKLIPRALAHADIELSAAYCASFDRLFKDGNADSVIALAEELLGPRGGLVFAGHRLDAPADWRLPPTPSQPGRTS